MGVITNVSHYAHVRREDKLNEKLREEANKNAKELIEQAEKFKNNL